MDVGTKVGSAVGFAVVGKAKVGAFVGSALGLYKQYMRKYTSKLFQIY
jgi:hypothetical protein